MKRFLNIILLIIIANTALADLGYCFKFKVKFNLKGDSSLIGYYVYPTYNFEDRNMKTLDESLKYYNETNEVKIYKDFVVLDSIDFHYKIACKQNDLVIIKRREIISTEILDYYPCCNDDKNYGFCGTAVITELNDDEIEKLRTKKPKLFTSFEAYYHLNLERLIIYTYNDNLTEQWINDMVNEMSPKGNEKPVIQIEKYKALKEYFRAKGVIIFKVNIGN